MNTSVRRTCELNRYIEWRELQERNVEGRIMRGEGEVLPSTASNSTASIRASQSMRFSCLVKNWSWRGSDDNNTVQSVILA